MDKTDINIRVYSKVMTNKRSLGYNGGGGKQLVLIREEIRT